MPRPTLLLRDPDSMSPVREEHVTEDDLEAFVMERLTHDHARRALTHVLDCERCSLRLIRETALIETLRETLREHGNRPPAA